MKTSKTYRPFVLLLVLMAMCGQTKAQRHVVGFNVLNISDLGHNSIGGWRPFLWAMSGFTYEQNRDFARWKFAVNYEQTGDFREPVFARARRTVVAGSFNPDRYRGFNVRAGIHNAYNYDKRVQTLYGVDLSYRGGVMYNSGFFARPSKFSSQILVGSYLGLKIQFDEFVSMQIGQSFSAGYQLQDREDRYKGFTFNAEPIQQVTVSLHF